MPAPARPPARAARSDAALARRLEAWFRAEARDLPWRPADLGAPRDPYRSLVSELMLQQTQVSRVAERFVEFVERFPTVRALANADEQEVLALWSGLGYYRRARLLHAAAIAVVEQMEGEFPSDPARLRELPGVGRYTAGAVASMAFGARTPIVDGNVARVLLRLDGRDSPPDDAATSAWLWERSGQMVEAADEPGVFNEALMELGATVCTPRSPACDRCPLARRCAAKRQGRQGEIPPPKSRAARRELLCDAVRVEDSRGRLLVERRGPAGLWAGLWQAPTLERDDRHARPAELRGALTLASVRRRHEFVHQTTHRIVRFRVWSGSPRAGARRERGEWRSPRAVAGLALSTPQRRILLGD